MSNRRFFKFSFLQYIKSLFAKWFFYLGFIPYLYDFLSVYLPEPLKSFRLPTWVNVLSILISFLLASYFSWLEINEKLKTFLDSETSFIVTPLIYRLTATKYLEEVKNKIKHYEDEIRILTSKENLNHPFGILPIVNPFNRQPTKEDYLKWIEEKKSLIKKIENFISKNKGILLTNFTISANGYDENIDIGIYIKEPGEFINNDDINLPWEESSSSVFGVDYKSLIRPQQSTESEPFWKNGSIERHYAECNLRYLKKDFSYYFMSNSFFIKTDNDEINFILHLNSKNSNGTKEYKKKISINDLEIKDLLDVKKNFS